MRFLQGTASSEDVPCLPKNSPLPRTRYNDRHHKQTTSWASDSFHAKRQSWAWRLKRALCGGSLRVIADITEPDLIEKTLGNIKRTRAASAHPQRNFAPTTAYAEILTTLNHSVLLYTDPYRAYAFHPSAIKIEA